MSEKKSMTAAEFRAMTAKRHGKAKPGARANEITKAILTFLNSNGFMAWRNNTMGVFDSKKAASRIVKEKPKTNSQAHKLLSGCYRKHHGIKGVPDIIGFHSGSGRFIGVEVKAGTDKESIFQKNFRQMANKKGAVVVTARSMEDVVQAFQDVGMLAGKKK